MTFGSDGKKKFTFKEISSENIKNRGKGDNDWDSFVNVPDVKWFKVKDNNKDKGHCFRPLPPFWDGADHWGIDIYVHYGIGADNNAYLCLNKMKIGNCPICEEITKTTDQKYAHSIRVVPRVLQWLIDRDNEKDGPMLWATPLQFDTTVCAVAVNRRTGSAKPVQNPDTGCDISFKTEGTKEHRKYLAQKCEDSSSLSDDADKYNEWLEYVKKYPLPSILKYYDYDYIYKVLHGKTPTESAETDVVKQESVINNTTQTRGMEKKEEEKQTLNLPHEHKFDYTYSQVMAATTEELDGMLSNIMEYLTVNENEVASLDDTQLKVYICSKLKLSPPVIEEESPATKLRNRFKRNPSVA